MEIVWISDSKNKSSQIRYTRDIWFGDANLMIPQWSLIWARRCVRLVKKWLECYTLPAPKLCSNTKRLLSQWWHIHIFALDLYCPICTQRKGLQMNTKWNSYVSLLTQLVSHQFEAALVTFFCKRFKFSLNWFRWKNHKVLWNEKHIPYLLCVGNVPAVHWYT